MRKMIGLLLVAGLVGAVVPRAVAGEQEDALAVVEQAIKAHGGADALNKAQTVVRTGTGTLTVFNDTSPFTDETAWSLPDKMRMATELNKKVRVTTVVNGDKGWQSSGGPAMEVGAERLREIHNEMYVQWLTTLTPLKKDDFKLSPLPDVKVNGAPAAGVKATSKGKPDVKLYFDKKTNLLVKVERRVSEAGLAVDKEDIYSDYKEFDGVQLPTKVLMQVSGRKFSELTSASYKFPKKIEDATFAKP